MFCQKCGNQVAEGAEFCHKCGTKAVVGEPAQPAALQPAAPTPQQTTQQPTQQKAVAPEYTQKSSSPVPPEIQEAYDRLKASAADCPKIRKIILKRNYRRGSTAMAVTIKGLFSKYVYETIAATNEPNVISVQSSLIFFIGGVFSFIDVAFLGAFIDGTYNVVLSLLFIAGCGAWMAITIFGHKEARAIVSHMNKTLDTELTPSSVGVTIISLLNAVGICLGIASFAMM